MCGIAGIVDFAAPATAHRDRVASMRRRLRHRGPDSEGEHVGTHAVLGHTRLAILDLTGGAQPMHDGSGRYTIVYNGELSNAAELRDELRAEPGVTFRTRSDTEVVLAAYERWGADCARRLSGMFAFFVWDRARERGFAARDRLGVKPLVYAREGSALVFASEAQAIARTAATRPRANLEAVLDVLVAPCFSGVDRTMFAGVEPLLPGTTLEVDREGVRVRPYWDWPCIARGPSDAERGVDAERAVAALREELSAAVSRALVADVSLGVFLSGGLDSTLIAAVMARELPGPLLAFTVTFDDQSRFDYARSTITNDDDTPFARAAAAELGLDHRLVHVARSEIAADLERVALTNDALPAWEQEIAQHRLARAAQAAGTKAVLVGDAADETHYGYHFLLDPAALAGPHVILARLGSVPVRREISSEPIGDAARRLRALPEAAGASFDGDAAERTAAMTYLIVKRWLPRLLHNGDVHTMSASVEARVPFGDVRLLDVAARIEPAVALRGGVEKWALREASRGLVPDAVRARKKSALPKDLGVEPVFRAEARRALDDPPELVRAIVDRAAVAELVGLRRALTEAERAVLFRVVTLTHWARHHEVACP